MQNEDGINIALSGWAGAGTSTVSLLLALILNRKYLPLGSVMRYLSAQLEEKYDKVLSAELEQDFQPTVGKTTDIYIDYKLLNDSNLVVESDLSAFRIGKHPKVFSIFIKADDNIRKKRIKSDSRKNEAPMAERDEVLRQEYMKLWDIDIFDEELIERKYNLIINNSTLTVDEEIAAILSRLKDHPRIKSTVRWSAIENRAEKYLKLYNKKGKQALKDAVTKNKLSIPVQDILTEMVKTFPEDVQTYPDEVQKIFLRL